ncbi:hypothetical protein V2J94_37270 [Streptomyces sp. DSM 41524]|uniref:Uncharacterized protein n=1 Tax=Streptomyces asiaticus subsp. ignotus TaxID=3098222 RepID=A0ABU7QA12_9ACTN|nr:hypothetical protein [Streptomyces sp. DSM 41524]
MDDAEAAERIAVWTGGEGEFAQFAAWRHAENVVTRRIPWLWGRGECLIVDLVKWFVFCLPG